jgi:hypothetical protein
MNRTDIDEVAVKTERPSAGAAAASIDKLDEKLRVSVDALLHLRPPPTLQTRATARSHRRLREVG